MNDKTRHDKLYSVPVVGHDLTAFGVTSTRDSHGNVLSGSNLKCADGENLHLDAASAFDLYSKIGISAKADLSPDGQTEVVGSLSPLEGVCRKAPAKHK